MKRVASRGIVWSILVGLVAWAGVAEARREYNPWTEARRDLERASHALSGIDDTRAGRAQRQVEETLKMVRKGEERWTPPESASGARETCADQVVKRLGVHEDDVRVRRDSGGPEDGVRVDWWVHKSEKREKSGFCIVHDQEVSRFRRN